MVICSADHFFMVGAEWDQTGSPIGGEYKFDHTKLGEAHAYCMKRFVTAVTSGIPLIIADNTNTTVEEMTPYYSVAKAFGAAVHIYTASRQPSEVAAAHARNTHNVPLHVVQAQAARIAARKLPAHWRADIVWF